MYNLFCYQLVNDNVRILFCPIKLFFIKQDLQHFLVRIEQSVCLHLWSFFGVIFWFTLYISTVIANQKSSNWSKSNLSNVLQTEHDSGISKVVNSNWCLSVRKEKGHKFWQLFCYSYIKRYAENILTQ